MPVIAGYPYTLGLEGKSYPILAEGFSLTYCVGAEGKHRTSSCQVSVMSTELMQTLLSSSESLLNAVVKDSTGAVIFTGVVRPHASFSVGQVTLDSVSLEVLDYTEKLHVKVYEKPDTEVSGSGSVVWAQDIDGLKVCDPVNPSYSLVHKLCNLAGITNIQAPTINITIPRYKLEHGEYLDEKLSTLLYECVHDYRFDASGKLIVFQTGAITSSTTGSSGERVIASSLTNQGTVSALRKRLQISRSDDIKDGAYITYPRYETRHNVKMYEESFTGYIIVGGGSPAWQDEDGKRVTWSPSGLPEGARDVIYSNFWITSKNESWGLGWTDVKSESVSNCDQKGGTVAWQYGAGGALFSKVQRRVTVYADATYLINTDEKIGISGASAESYTASVIADAQSARSLMFALSDRGKMACITYSFQSFDELAPGSIYTLKETAVSGISSPVRILSRKESDTTGLYTYEAEGYGTPTLSAPTIDNQGETQPWEDPDFFLLSVSEDLIAADPETDDSPIHAITEGMIFDKYGGTPVWSLNGVAMPEYDGMMGIDIEKSRFASGTNRLSVSADYNGETYRLDALVKNIIVNLQVTMQYAVLDDGDTPDASTVWTDGQPEQTEGKIVWVRFRTSESAEWIVLRMTGSNGGNPVVYFQWAETPYVSPDEGYDLMCWDDDTAIVWQMSDGSYMGFAAAIGKWETMVPEKPADKNYLWVKYYNYQTEQWDFFCTTGTPAISFDLAVSPTTYKLTSRGCVASDSTLEDGLQRIYATVTKINTDAPCTWTIDSDLVDWEYVYDYSDAEIVIKIPTHTEAGDPLALPSFTIKASIADIEMAKELQVLGIQEGKAQMEYIGIYDTYEELSQVTATSEGDLIVGDHALVENADGNRVPYYWTGSKWEFAGMSTPIEIQGKIMMDTMYDALHSESTQESLSVIDAYIFSLATNAIFANYAKLRDLVVGTADGATPDVGLYVHIGYKDDGSPIYDVRFNGKTVFYIDPATGKTFFGQPNSSYSAPLDGFMYAPPAGSETRGTIRSANDKVVINADGTITADGLIASNVDINGIIEANELYLPKVYGGYEPVSIAGSNKVEISHLISREEIYRGPSADVLVMLTYLVSADGEGYSVVHLVSTNPIPSFAVLPLKYIFPVKGYGFNDGASEGSVEYDVTQDSSTGDYVVTISTGMSGSRSGGAIIRTLILK